MPASPHSDVTQVYQPGDTAADDAAHEPSAAPGKQIGPYTLLETLGEGGMGIVYLAEQVRPVRRRVALKVIRPGKNSAQVVARFEAERQALALMDHVNIARVLDAGTTDNGLPYFAMELVDGIPITRFCDEQRLTPRDRLALFATVCHAIHHAHQKGIIHRDIKPSNVLVSSSDGKPLAKVIDFGVAKATGPQLAEHLQATQFGAIIGTLEYMSPEQAMLSDQGIDTRSDIYSLGVLLYELLTGSTPIDWRNHPQAGFTDLLRMVGEVEPPRPSTQIQSSASLAAIAAARHTEPQRLAKLVRGDLDWIVMKCLEKDRARRYESAGNVARDVERYLADETVEASPPSTSYRLRRLARKHRGALMAAALLLLALVAGAGLATWQAARATLAEQQMKVERDRTRLALTQQVAERLDGDLRRMAAVGHVLAATLAERDDWTEAQLENWVRTVLAQDERIFGQALAFAPFAFEPQRENFCLYAYRDGDAIRTKQLLPPEYTPLYREWSWYRDPLRDNAPTWSEPYVDTGGGDAPMVTYSTPMSRDGQALGVLTLDLSVEYFEVLRDWLDELALGAASYGFIVSDSGVIVSHPDPRFDFAHRVARDLKPWNIHDYDAIDPAWREIVARFGEELSGSGTAIAPATGRRSQIHFASIPSAKWTFVSVIAEED